MSVLRVEHDLTATLRTVAMLRGDPTVRLVPGRLDRATLTPHGPASMRVTWTADEPVATAEVRTWGPGAGWLEAHAAAAIGLDDDVAGFDPPVGPLRDLWARHHRVRLSATGTLWHDLAAVVVQQRITVEEAARQWAALVRSVGAPAPGPVDLLLPPDPGRVARLAPHALHTFGLERSRAEALVGAARAVHRTGVGADRPFAEVAPVLAAVRGIGPWTLGMLEAFTWGAADALIPGDARLPGMVCWLLAGEPRGHDARMVELLEPHRPHRLRVVSLAVAGGVRPPRRAPRRRVVDIRRM